MYENFYGFKESPFNMTPDPKFFFPSQKHTEALDSLTYAINERKGFVVITGEIGAGKTTVCRTLLNRLAANTKIALIINTYVTAKEMLMAILDEFGVEYKHTSKGRLLSRLNEFLIEQLSQNINLVLIIDEAQNLTPSVLEEIRMISNLETETEKLIQIILMGQPQLKEKLSLPRLEQLRQRIVVHYHINPLNKDEMVEYIEHRLKIATSNGFDFFTPAAMELIYRFSKGTPRLVNIICDSALLSGYVYEAKQIDEKIMSEAIKEAPFSKL
ncbi:MAG: XrtA-associated ATPase [Candidatus Omnitrophota bacterium]|nr:XrtA-associated ATPase [Candidatus Omnitrophota bacterium]